MRRASSAWPMVLLILCAPVWFRSSRLSRMRAPPTSSRQALGVVDRARAADVVREVVLEFGDEGRVDARRVVGGGQFLQRADQGLGHEAPAEAAEMAGRRRGSAWKSISAEPAIGQAQSGVAVGTTDFFDETPHLIAVLDPGRAFDAAGHIHAPRQRRHRPRRTRCPAAGRRPGRTGLPSPVGTVDQSKTAPAAALLALGVAVEQEGRGAGVASSAAAIACWRAAPGPGRPSGCALRYGRPKPRQKASSSRAVELQQARAHLLDHVAHFVGRCCP